MHRIVKKIATAQTSHYHGKLQDVHFALCQMMQELHISIGKKVLKLFPASTDSLQLVLQEENVSGSSQFASVTTEKTMVCFLKKLLKTW